MRLGVMADSHDNVPKVRQAVELFNQRGVDLVVHAGDFVAPFAVAPLADLECRVVAVLGNNDGEVAGLTKKFEAIGGELHPHLAETELDGRKIAAVHYPELAGPLSTSGYYDLVVFGHTHEIEIRPGEERPELPRMPLVLNPGETGGWLSGRATVALVDLETLSVEIAELP